MKSISQTSSVPTSDAFDADDIIAELRAKRTPSLNGIVTVENISVRRVKTSTGELKGFALDGMVAGKRISALYVGQVGFDRLGKIDQLAIATYPGKLAGSTLNLRARTRVLENGREYLDLDA